MPLYDYFCDHCKTFHTSRQEDTVFFNCAECHSEMARSENEKGFCPRCGCGVLKEAAAGAFCPRCGANFSREEVY